MEEEGDRYRWIYIYIDRDKKKKTTRPKVAKYENFSVSNFHFLPHMYTLWLWLSWKKKDTVCPNLRFHFGVDIFLTNFQPHSLFFWYTYS